MRAQARQHLAQAVAEWHRQGLIGTELRDRLTTRYASQGQFSAALAKWLGLIAMLLLGLAVLSFLAMMAESVVAGAVLLAGVAAALWHYGVRLATDPFQAHPLTGSALLALGLAAGGGVLILLALGLGWDEATRVPAMILLLTGAAGIATAYRYHLRWPLLLGLLLCFHGLGAWHRYGGHGAYFADIQEPRVMAVVALLTTVFGVYHGRVLEQRVRWRRCTGFGGLYVIFGLLYLNVSLWFLTLPEGPLAWVLVFAAAGVAQLVAGARLHDARFTGFGIVFLAINFYTRLFEHFRDQLSLGTFFLIAGVLAIVLGFGFERRGRRLDEDEVP